MRLYWIISTNTSTGHVYSQNRPNMPQYKQFSTPMENKDNNIKMSLSTDHLYQCPECGLKYRDKEWAEKCEAWCKAHRSCNLEITAHAEKETAS